MVSQSISVTENARMCMREVVSCNRVEFRILAGFSIGNVDMAICSTVDEAWQSRLPDEA